MNNNNKLRCPHGLGVPVLLGLLMLAGCATVHQPLQSNLQAQSAAVRQCAEAFRALDTSIERAGVRDAEAYRIPGFPYLRVDRFSAQLRRAAGKDDKAMAQWVSRLRALDQDARRAEISNLPEAEMLALESGGRAALIDNTARCAEVLRARDLELPERARWLSARAQVPDDYSTWQRLAGLYALSSVPFSRGIAQWHSETLRDFQNPATARIPAQSLTRYAMANPSVVTRERIAAIIRRASDNPLHVPEYTDADRAMLVSAYAPVFEIGMSGVYDRIGRLVWKADVAPDVDTRAPVVYYRMALTRYGDRTLTQIVYTLWFPERPQEHALDMLAGRLDGVMFRVTLSPEGDPLVYDSIHACGCFHMFFPTARVRAIAAPDGAGEWAFVPVTLPERKVGARLAVQLATRTHYLINVALAGAGDAIGYSLLPEQELRTLPTVLGTRSAYGADGLVPGTARGERLFFWPMGIASAGAMRQWGHHATAFVGRRHFDDADLIEKRFQIITP